MNIRSDVSLADHSTMGLGGQAAYLVEVTSADEVGEAVNWALDKNLPCLMIGSGSNVVWQDNGFPGLVIVNNIGGYSEREENGSVLVTIGAGEIWDGVVKRTVDAGLSGIEALSLIPGKTGATPVQNVSAYGQEIADSLVSLDAYDKTEKKLVTLEGSDCGFAYRTSRFKTSDRGRFFITSIVLKLVRSNPSPPFYKAVETYFSEHGITEFTPNALREAVISIRTSKLPDPAKVHNAGSFFTNPIISEADFSELVQGHGDEIPHWSMPDNTVKLSAAWLIDKAGFRDVHDQETGIGTWPKQPLVLVNEHAKNTADLLAFKAKVVYKVKDQFGIELVQEPELLP
jgi:UDP-N-acetylmuramate dehydrogenase